MAKATAALLILLALAAEVAFFATGAWGSPAPALAASLGSLAGSPALAAGGALALLLGVLLWARPAAGEAFPTAEVVQLLSAVASGGCGAALLAGAARGWSERTLAAIALAGCLEAALALALTVRLAVAAERRRSLFVPGVAGTALAVGFHGLVFLLGAA